MRESLGKINTTCNWDRIFKMNKIQNNVSYNGNMSQAENIYDLLRKLLSVDLR